MADVFISYSRKDIQFAQRIHHELEARDREPWVDWQDIPPTAEWLDEVYAGIQEADTFLFIISPDSVVSEICILEIEHAIQHNKRLVPVVLHDVEDDQVHSAMSAHNWVFLREEDDFEANLELLISALDADLAYIKEHTRLLTRAIEWDKNNRTRGLALSDHELQMAEDWLTLGFSTDPKPTDLHSQYVVFSRNTITRSQRVTIGISIFMSIAMVIMTCVCFILYDNSTYHTHFAINLSALAQLVSENSAALIAFGSTDEASDLLKSMSANDSVVAAALYVPTETGSKNQRIFASYINPMFRGESFPDKSGLGRSVYEGDSLIVVRKVLDSDGEEVGKLYLKAHTKALSERRKKIYFFGLICSIFSVFFVLVVLFIQFRVSRRRIRVSQHGYGSSH